jgi:hypothetical protein
MNLNELQIKNVKYAEWASEETACYEATVYFRGKRVFMARNEGHGGCDDFEPIKGESMRDAHIKVEEVAKAIYPRTTDCHEKAQQQNKAEGLTLDELSWDEFRKARDDGRMWQTPYEVMESAIAALLDRHLREKDLKKLLRDRLVFVRDGKLYTSNKARNKATLQLWLESPKTDETLGAEVVLNRLSFDEAFDLYIKHG